MEGRSVGGVETVGGSGFGVVYVFGRVRFLIRGHLL